jgi:hypothetical protein
LVPTKSSALLKEADGYLRIRFRDALTARFCPIDEMIPLDATAFVALLREFGWHSASRVTNPFRAKAYARAADNLLALSVPLDQAIAQSTRELEKPCQSIMSAKGLQPKNPLRIRAAVDAALSQRRS